MYPRRSSQTKQDSLGLSTTCSSHFRPAETPKNSYCPIHMELKEVNACSAELFDLMSLVQFKSREKSNNQQIIKKKQALLQHYQQQNQRIQDNCKFLQVLCHQKKLQFKRVSSLRPKGQRIDNIIAFKGASDEEIRFRSRKGTRGRRIQDRRHSLLEPKPFQYSPNTHYHYYYPLRAPYDMMPLQHGPVLLNPAPSTYQHCSPYSPCRPPIICHRCSCPYHGCNNCSQASMAANPNPPQVINLTTRSSQTTISLRISESAQPQLSRFREYTYRNCESGQIERGQEVTQQNRADISPSHRISQQDAPLSVGVQSFQRISGVHTRSGYRNSRVRTRPIQFIEISHNDGIDDIGHQQQRYSVPIVPMRRRNQPDLNSAPVRQADQPTPSPVSQEQQNNDIVTTDTSLVVLNRSILKTRQHMDE